LTKAYRADENKKAILRMQLYKYLLPRYEAMKIRGYYHVQFLFPNNISFLRMHKPSKFGDNLQDTRYSFSYTNTTKQPISGFEKGRTSHGFRNIFPIFDANESYLGSYELSFSSDSIQNTLSNVNKIHSHFLVHKNIFDAKMWEKKDNIITYISSIENDSYKYTVLNQTDYKRRTYTERNILKKHKQYIYNQMKLSKKFAIYTKIDDQVTTVTFLPILNTQGETRAYLVSYSKSEHIADYLSNYKWINIVTFIVLLIIFILVYNYILYKNSLEITTREQKELLSLFDKGDTTIFKWRNDKSWSVSYVSKNVKLMTGYTKNEFESGAIDYLSIIDSRDRESVVHMLQYILDNHINIFKQKSYRIKTKGGETKWLLNTSQVIHNAQGQVTHLLGYLTDITDIKNQELILKKSEKELETLTKDLQHRVEIEVAQNRKKDKLLQEQAKLAAMGEMIGAIAHQWRQPLNALNINIQNLDDDYAEDLIDAKFIDEYIETQTHIIQFMSQTIDDFQNFFKINKTKTNFSIKNAIEKTISIQSAQLKNNSISIQIVGEDFLIKTYESEFKQVILNLISNAKDAILTNTIESGTIIIDIKDKTITISDNGGGIPEDILDRVFEPYFTTKEQGGGTGIGLYMSKMIIERSMHGTLQAYNSKDGANFVISL
jgi:PAS domain S-box-containing protein